MTHNEKMDWLLGDYIGYGAQANVYHASESYTQYIIKHTDGVYGARFVVKVMDYDRYQYGLIGDSSSSDIINKLQIYQKITDQAIAHVIPLVHWIVYEDETHSVDKFYSKIEDIQQGKWTTLIMVFPLLETTVDNVYKHLTVDKRKDICAQMIYILQGLHSIGISHGDFHLKNLMCSLMPNGFYYVHVIDLDLANRVSSLNDDYVHICNNITRVMYLTVFSLCEEIESKEKLYDCLIRIYGKIGDMNDRKRAFDQLGEIFNETSFDDAEFTHLLKI